jgi:hypothetical protein
LQSPRGRATHAATGKIPSADVITSLNGGGQKIGTSARMMRTRKSNLTGALARRSPSALALVYSEYAEYTNWIRKDERRFVEDVARLLTPWGVPPVAARLYGYLLLCPRPVNLDQITKDLEIGKSSASVATRLLESYTLARRHSEAGTKRALYAVADDYEAMIRQQNRLLDALAGQLNTGAGIAASKAVSVRLQEMADFYRVMRGAMEDAMGRWKRRQRPR